MVDKTDTSKHSNGSRQHSHRVKQYPVANAAIGMVGAGLGVAAAAGIGPIVVPAVVVGGLAGYLLTNKTPVE